jgi:adenosine/AMP kinase
MELTSVPIDKPTDVNFILGQSHFIKTIEDLHEAIVQTVPQMKFGIAFCVYCATGNPVEVIVVDTGNGRGILGVVDGATSKGFGDAI